VTLDGGGEVGGKTRFGAELVGACFERAATSVIEDVSGQDDFGCDRAARVRRQRPRLIPQRAKLTQQVIDGGPRRLHRTPHTSKATQGPRVYHRGLDGGPAGIGIQTRDRLIRKLIEEVRRLRRGVPTWPSGTSR